MRIIVSDVAAKMGGALTVLKDLYNYILENDSENEWIFLLCEPFLEEKGNIKVVVYEKTKSSYISRMKYDLFEGKKLEKRYNPDLFFSLQNNVFRGVNTPQAVYMHQSLPFQKVVKFSPFKRDELKSWFYANVVGHFIKKSLPKASKIVVQTKWIKEAICESTGVDFSIVMVAAPTVTTHVPATPQEWKQGEFVVPVTDVKYKNTACIENAVNILNEKRIDDFSVDITFSKENTGKGIQYVGYLDKESLWEEYYGKTVIFPSYIETFGLPLAEARKTGTVILAADLPYAGEVLDGYENAYFFDPFCPEELADLMEKVIKGDIVKKDCKTAENETSRNPWGDVIESLREIIAT